MASWVLRKILYVFQTKMPFDDNKLYCSEVLSILLQNHEGKLERYLLYIVILTIHFLCDMF